MEAAQELENHWSDDLMHRQPYADFLTTYIEDRVSKSGDSLTITLDAKWGTGKTFFVNRWVKDLAAKNRGVVVFDAWTNDFSPEPLTSFMSELSEGMKSLHARLPATTAAATTIKEKTNGLMKVFQKTALPAAGVIATGIIKKATGIAIDELMSTGSLDEVMEQDWGSVTKGVGESLEKGLGALFQKSLEEHQARAKAAGTLKKTLEELVKLLQQANVIEGPLYIFIDELDRCRPDYSIKLLEGIKHLFAVPGVVFIVSTNLEQLSKSVQGVYGPGFNGQRYLKRFFDFEFTLPAPDTLNFAASLEVQFPIGEVARIDDGLSPGAYKGENRIVRSFERIATAFGLELRDQKQVWVVAQAAATGIPKTAKISTIWLFFLASFRHIDPTQYDKLFCGAQRRGTVHEALAALPGWTDSNLESIHYASDQSGFRVSHAEVQNLPLSNVLQPYYAAMFLTIEEISRTFNTSHAMESYPQSLIYQMVQERPSPYNARDTYIPAIAQYPRLVRMAGLIS